MSVCACHPVLLFYDSTFYNIGIDLYAYFVPIVHTLRFSSMHYHQCKIFAKYAAASVFVRGFACLLCCLCCFLLQLLLIRSAPQRF